jgi:CTP:molybdopterin cytidylyltransferase MocA
MGHPKALLTLGARPLVLDHLAALRPFAADLTVVLGAHEEAIRALIPADVHVVVNPQWEHTHPIDSLRLALSDSPAFALVQPVDTVPARASTLAALLAAGAPAVPTDPAGRDGHPVLLDRPTIARVLHESAPHGLRGLLSTAKRVPVADPWTAVDFDDPPAFAALHRRRRADD